MRGARLGELFLFEQAMLTGVAVCVCVSGYFIICFFCCFLAFGVLISLFAQFDASFFGRLFLGGIVALPSWAVLCGRLIGMRELHGSWIICRRRNRCWLSWFLLMVVSGCGSRCV
ncbi:hypothetical protein V8C44DRAFT_326752 [Trichoderma aethiopicum]